MEFRVFLTMFEQLPHVSALWSSRLSHLFGGLTPLAFLRFVLLFLQERKPGKIHPAHHLLAAGTALGCLSPWLNVDVPEKLFFPCYPEPGPAYLFLLGGYFFTYFTSFRHLHATYRDPSVDRSKRMQSIWMLFGCILAWISVATLFLPIYNIPVVPQMSFFPFIGISTVFVIVRYRFLDIEVVLRKSLVYSVLTAVITGINLVMVLVMERWFQGFIGYKSVLATSLVAFFVTVFFNPLRSRIQALVDRAIFQGTPDQLAKQREQLIAEVQRGEQMRSVATLAVGLAHEIKNPLTAIRTFTEYLDAKHEDPEFRSKFQRIVGGELEKINHIVQQLLDFAKPQPLQLANVSVSGLITDTLELLNRDMLQRGVQVETHFDEGVTVNADGRQLRQVFLNLFLNSLDAMESGGRLTIATKAAAGKVQITVGDTGKGIPVEQLPRIFEPFFTTKTTGTGLGLAVVRNIISEHGGTITVGSEPGKGVCMTIILPESVIGEAQTHP